jgi:hypothetical protein
MDEEKEGDYLFDYEKVILEEAIILEDVLQGCLQSPAHCDLRDT